MAHLDLQLSFIVPLGSRPKECFDEITPHDMRSDLSCASSGALIIFGGWSAVIWSMLPAKTLAHPPPFEASITDGLQRLLPSSIAPFSDLLGRYSRKEVF